MGGDEQSNVIVPATGAAKYWYTDPSAAGVPSPDKEQPFDPMISWDEQGHSKDFLDALQRIGLLSEQESDHPSF